jgi:hypothetical protein
MIEREIVAGAMERASEAERAAFLDGACGGDVALRGRIDGLLREQEELGSYLESPPLALAGAVGTSLPFGPPNVRTRSSAPTS